MIKQLTVFIFLFAAFVFTACASDSATCDSTASVDMDGDSSQVACTSSYEIKYTPTTTPTEGKSEFTLTITKLSDDSGYSGANPAVKPVMVMSSMEHGSVLDIVTDNGDGTYDVIVYYLMASTMNGNSMGTWELYVTVDDETGTVYPSVMMSMGDTAKATLKNDSDMIAGMTGAAETRSYYLFKDEISGSTGSHMFSLMIATRESMMSHPAVFVGSQLTDENGSAWTVSTMSVQASTDQSTWISLMDNGDGHWSGMGITGLTDGMEGTIYVQMTINGLTYTASGSPAAFTVTPGGGEMWM